MGPLYTYVHNCHLTESLVAITMILETLLVVDFILLKIWNHTYSSLGYGMVQLDLFRVSNKNDFFSMHAPSGMSHLFEIFGQDITNI